MRVPVLPIEGQLIAQELGCRFVETSAKLGINVTETFFDLVCEIRDRNRVGCSVLVLSSSSLSLPFPSLPFPLHSFYWVMAVPITHFAFAPAHILGATTDAPQLPRHHTR
jgi:hypothetical protein